MINATGPNFSPLANAITPFTSVGRTPVGLENIEAKDDLLAPVEEAPQDEKALNDNEDKSEQKKVNEKQDSERDRASDDGELGEDDIAELRELKARDAEVRAHEQAHASVGGKYAGAASFSYQTGPNGIKYAVGGEVPISLPSSSGNPEQAIRAADQVRRAALAPANPSGQDISVAAKAAQISQSAQAQRRELQAEERALEVSERSEAQKERELVETKRKSRNESLRQSNLLSSNLSTPENISSNNGVGQLLDQTA